MSDVIKVKRSAVAAKVPLTTDFVVGELAANTYDGKLYLRGNNGADFVQLIGAPTAGQLQKILQWYGSPGIAPIESFENAQRVFLYAQGAGEQLTAWVRIPSAYQAGTAITLKVLYYTPGNTNFIKFTSTSVLLRRNTDVVTTATNFNGATSGDVALGTANAFSDLTLAISDGSGQFNGVAASPGDLIWIVLTRSATSGTDNTNDVRLIADACEIIFS